MLDLMSRASKQMSLIRSDMIGSSLTLIHSETKLDTTRSSARLVEPDKHNNITYDIIFFVYIRSFILFCSYMSSF